MFKVVTGTRVKLRGKTRKGKNRVSEHGQEWVAERISDRVLFDDRPGPWCLAAPVASKHPKAEHASRWINLRADQDFHIEEIPCAEPN